MFVFVIQAFIAMIEYVHRNIDSNQCRNIQENIILTYEDDFSKYKKRVYPDLLRATKRGHCYQIGEKLTYKQISVDEYIIITFI